MLFVCNGVCLSICVTERNGNKCNNTQKLIQTIGNRESGSLEWNSFAWFAYSFCCCCWFNNENENEKQFCLHYIWFADFIPNLFIILGWFGSLAHFFFFSFGFLTHVPMKIKMSVPNFRTWLVFFVFALLRITNTCTVYVLVLVPVPVWMFVWT